MIFRGRLLHPIYGVLIFVGLLLIVGGWQALDASAALTFKPAAQTSPLHPDITLLDEDGVNVLESGKPVSTMQTCGECHDTAFIAEHSGHSQAGLDTLAPPGSTATGRPWDLGDGIFGKWDPMVYRVLSAQGGPALDLGTAGWVQRIGARHVGGGPAQTSRDGTPSARPPGPCRRSRNKLARSRDRTGAALGLAAVRRGRDELLPVSYG